MKQDLEQTVDSKKIKELEDRIKRLKYNLVSDYTCKQNRENLLMFIMDV